MHKGAGKCGDFDRGALQGETVGMPGVRRSAVGAAEVSRTCPGRKELGCLEFSNAEDSEDGAAVGGDGGGELARGRAGKLTGCAASHAAAGIQWRAACFFKQIWQKSARLFGQGSLHFTLLNL